jgi:photosystem II stability/assembly factor-like uncharacterized protein
VNANTGYVCGNNGRLLKSINGGLNWSIQNPSSTDTLVSIDFVNELTGWCAGRDFIVYTTNGGSQWYRQNVDTSIVKPRFTVLKMFDSQNGLAGAYRKNTIDMYAYIYRTSNGGVSWQFQDSAYGYRIYSICYVNQSIVYLSSLKNLFKSNNGGNNWTMVSYLPGGINLSKIQFIDENNGINSQNTGLYKTTNGGNNWTINLNYVMGLYSELNYTTNGNIFVATNKGSIYKSTNEGTNWGNYSINIESNIYEIKIFDENNIYLGGDGLLCKSTNGGVNWNIKYRGDQYFIGQPVFCNNIGFSNMGDKIFKTTNSGENWFQINGTFQHYIRRVYCTNENNLWIVGDSGLIMRTTNSGINWENKSVADSITVYNININNNNIFVSTIWGILKSTDYGTNWVQVTLDGLFYSYNIYFLNSLTGWVIPTSDLQFYKTTDGGNNWIKYNRQIENGLPTLRCSFVNENTGYAAALDYYHGLLKTTNSGFNWFIVTSYPYQNYMTNNVSFINENTGWVVGSQGLILKTTNGGTSFISVNNQNVPDKFSLSQNYPNPFNPSTNIKYQIAKNSFVTLKVFDILGKEIATLVKEKQNSGTYESTFDARGLTSGVYFYRLTAGDFSETKKMLMIK